MKLSEIDVKYVTFLIIGTDGKCYLCMPHWPTLVEIALKPKRRTARGK